MSFDVDVARRLGDLTVGARFASDARAMALFGPSGAGKSSILNMVAGLLRPDRGRVVVAGRTLFDAAAGIDLPPEERRCGYIFQDARLFPHRRVAGNLRYGADRAAPAERRIGLDEVTGLLGIVHLLDRWPRTLSGGEAQRVAIGRALLAGARVLLMDEPLAAIDLPRRDEILALIARVRDELGVPILYVAHDRGEVEHVAETVVAVAPLACA